MEMFYSSQNSDVYDKCGARLEFHDNSIPDLAIFRFFAWLSDLERKMIIVLAEKENVVNSAAVGIPSKRVKKRKRKRGDNEYRCDALSFKNMFIRTAGNWGIHLRWKNLDKKTIR